MPRNENMGSVSPYERQSKFEKYEADVPPGSFPAELGKRLRQIYASPGRDTEPVRLAKLLLQLDETVDDKHISETIE